MYPDEFPRDAWYVVAPSSDVGEQPRPRRVLGDPVLLSRAADGRPLALADRGAGAWPVHEQSGLVWAWPGHPGRADPARLPAYPWYADAGWVAMSRTLHLNARAQLLTENLLDLSHLSFLHPETVGSAYIAETPVTVRFDDRTVTVRRDMRRVRCYPFLTQLTGIDEPIDRAQISEFTAPSFIVTTADARPHADPDDSRSCTLKALHAITPETRTSSHYFWAAARNYATGNQQATDAMREWLARVLDQDVLACEAIEHIIGAWEPCYPVELNIKVDAGPLQSRRIVARMTAAERRSAA